MAGKAEFHGRKLGVSLAQTPSLLSLKSEQTQKRYRFLLGQAVKPSGQVEISKVFSTVNKEVLTNRRVLKSEGRNIEINILMANYVKILRNIGINLEICKFYSIFASKFNELSYDSRV
jgi:hypothetical protein